MSVVDFRRALHSIPELDRCLPKTVTYVKCALAGLPCRVTEPAEGAVCAFFDAGKSETVAFRADMDALPVTEVSSLPYASVHPGVMHACGHDGHTAMALALAHYAGAHLEELPRNVLFIFQPAEETTGGADPICRTGILREHNVTRVFGLHLWPGVPAGRVAARPGAMMARSSETTVTVTGKSVHISRHGEGIDALTAGAEFLRRAYAMMAALPQEDPALLRFGKMTSGTVRNAISGETRLEGSLRTYSDEIFEHCRRELTAIGETLQAETGCGITVHLSEGYPAVRNHPDLYEAVCAALGDDAPLPLDTPALAAEDFSFYQKEVPGVFFFLGTGDTPQLHAQDFDFDDETVLPAGVEFLKKLMMLP